MRTVTEYRAQKSYALRLSRLLKKDETLSTQLLSETSRPRQLRLLRRRNRTMLLINSVLVELKAMLPITLLIPPTQSPLNPLEP